MYDDIIYSGGGFNLIHCANVFPYSGYEVGDCLGISIGEIEKSGYNAPFSSEVFNDKDYS